MQFPENGEMEIKIKSSNPKYNIYTIFLYYTLLNNLKKTKKFDQHE